MSVANLFRQGHRTCTPYVLYFNSTAPLQRSPSNTEQFPTFNVKSASVASGSYSKLTELRFASLGRGG